MSFLPIDLLPLPEQLQHLRLVANGTEPGDIIVRGGKVVALHTGEVLLRDVVIAGSHIAAVTPVGRFDAPEIIDATGLFVIPTFIDTHIHIEYTMLTPGELARVIVPKGTTTLLADPNCIANVLGAPGMDLVATTGTPLRILQQISPEVPRLPDKELGGAVVTSAETLERMGRANAVTLGEGNPFNLSLDSAIKQWTALAAGKRITGHTARLSEEPLWAYIAGGVGDDHNAFNTDEVLERLRLGMAITVMSGSMNDNCPAVFADLDALGMGMHHICFCADDKHVEDLAEQGHIDHHVRQAIRAGVDPVMAIRMATLNAATHFRLDHLLGSITPSRLADLMLVEDLADPSPTMVVVGGAVVAEHGEPRFANTDTMPDWSRGTMHLAEGLGASSFAVTAEGDTAWVQAVEMYDGYFKRAFHAELAVADGVVAPDTDRDVLKVAIVDRHHATTAIGMGFVRGFGMRRGAIAATTNCENQNLVIVGTTDADIAHAALAAAGIGGGYVAVADGEVLATCPLPIAGIMSDEPWEIVRDQSVAVNAAAAALGCTIQAPFMIMAFIGLAGVPDLGLTEKGLIDVASQSFVDVVLTALPGQVCCRCPTHAHDVHRLFDPASVAQAGGS
ncbi:MAG: Adenine deaminase [Ilumatobacteraceae bacterium]|nr:Adenine deaminase [Ilumatobacteraceae bacterium]